MMPAQEQEPDKLNAEQPRMASASDSDLSLGQLTPASDAPLQEETPSPVMPLVSSLGEESNTEKGNLEVRGQAYFRNLPNP